MASIDERVVAMSFENKVFEQRIAQTMSTLTKFNTALASVGKSSSFADIEKAAQKVTLTTPMTALDKLRQRLFGASQGAQEGFSGIETAGGKVTLQAPMSALDRLRFRLAGASQGAAEGMAGIDAAGNRVRLDGPLTALDRLRSRLFGISTGAAEGFNGIERASHVVSLLNPLTAIDRIRSRLFGVGDGAKVGFDSIERASAGVTLSGIGRAVDAAKSQFNGLQVFAIGAISGLISGVIAKTKSLGNSLSLGPITDGFKEYTTNLRSIQTILSNTEQAGTKLKDVEKALKELNRYSDKTIYNFSQMADAVGLFTAAGVDLDTSVASIKGIANLTALGGKNMEQARSAMVQLSQAVASGKVDLQTWNTLVNSGIAGPKFQQGLVRNAVQMGKLDESMVKTTDKMGNLQIKGESFRNSVMAKPGEESWLTSKVLTQTLQQFTGDMTDAELAAQGFNKSQIKAIQTSARAAEEAATKVRDIKGVWDVAVESMGSGWSETWRLIFGDFKGASTLFTGLSKSIGDVIGKSADARNKILGDFNKLGGRKVVIDGIVNAFKALVSFLKPVRDAFRDVFPRKTGEDLFRMAEQFRDFMKSMRLAPDTAENLKRVFRGLFSVFHIGWTVIKGVAGVIFDLLGTIGRGSGGILAFGGNLGDLIYNFDQAISKGKGFSGFFKSLTKVLQAPMDMLKTVANAIKTLFGAGDNQGKGTEKSIDTLEQKLGPLGKAISKIIEVWVKFWSVLSEKVRPVLDKVGDVFSSIGETIKKAVDGVNYDRVMEGVQTGLLAGLAVGIKKLLGGIGLDLSGGSIAAFKDVMGTLTKTLTAIQNNINARTMLLIAGAVLALAGATIIFANIDPKKLAQAATAITIGIAQLSGAMLILAKSSATFYSLPFIATGMLLLAGALVILGGAMHIMARLSWEDMIKGLTGIGGSLAAINLAIRGIGPGLILVGPGLLVVALALTTLAIAMSLFATLSWGEMAKGLVGIAGGLTAISLTIGGLGPSMLLVGPGLIAASFGLILLAGAVRSFGSMDLITMGKGLLGIGAALLVVGVAVSAIPPTIAAQAIGLGIVAVALIGIATAIGIMGSLDVWTIVKGLFTMGAALVILAVGLTAMSGTAAGALGLLAAAGAFAILAPALALMGNLKWQTILVGLGTMAAILLVLGGVGTIVAAPMTALGIALIAIGAGAVLAAAAVYLIAAAVGKLGDEGTKGVGIFVASLTALIALFPKMAIDFLKGIVTILEGLVMLAPKIMTSLVQIVNTLINGLLQIAPKAQVLFSNVIAMIIQTVDQNAGPLISAGFRLLLNFLNGLASNIGPVTSAVARIITGFLGALAGHMPRLIAAGARALVNWLHGMASRLPSILAAGARLIGTFLQGMAQRLPGIVTRAAQMISSFLNAVANRLPSVMAAGVRVIVAAINGVANALPRIIRAGTNVVIAFIRGIGNAAPRLADAGFKAVIRFMNGMASAIRSNDDAMIKAGWNVASAMGEGLLKGLTSIFPQIRKKASDLISSLPGAFKKVLGIKSPSTVMMAIGKQTMVGLGVGITSNKQYAIGAATVAGNDVASAASSAMYGIPAWTIPIAAQQPVITPVLDLSQVEKEAQRLWALTSKIPLDVGGALTTAKEISRDEMNRGSENTAGENSQQPILNYEQNNYSPESLSDIEIYRKTKNQLSQVKDALGLATKP